MLGNYLVSKFSNNQNHETIALTRKDFDIGNSTKDSLYQFIRSVRPSDGIIINASGIIKQRKNDLDEMIEVNSIFPHRLEQFSKDLSYRVIHVTTDCVFSGSVGKYDENSRHDCYDLYGKSKSMGENDDSCVIRTSIIGEEINNKKSLLEWCRSMSGKKVNGYTNHLWNGVTCLELATFIEKIIDNDSLWRGIKHIHSDDISKFDLVNLLNKKYSLGLAVEPFETETKCDRTLRSIFSSQITKSLEEQVEELKNYQGVKG